MKITTLNKDIVNSDSYALANILNLFKEFGTYSNLKEHKYGISFDFNQTISNELNIATTRFIAIGYSKLRFLKDGRVTTPLVYQAIFNLWADMGMECNMYVIGMNPINNKYYISKNVFWEITKYICDYPWSKALNLKEIKVCAGGAYWNISRYNTIAKSKIEYVLNERLNIPAPYQVFTSLEKFLDNINEYLSLYERVYSMTLFELIDQTDAQLIAEILTRAIEIFSLRPNINDLLQLSPNRAINSKYYQKTIDEFDLINATNFRYWIEKSIEENPKSEGVSLTSSIAMKILIILLPRFINKFRIIRKHSEKSIYFWLDNDAEFLKAILSLDLPEIHTSNDLLSLKDNIKNYRKNFEKEIIKCRKLYHY